PDALRLLGEALVVEAGGRVRRRAAARQVFLVVAVAANRQAVVRRELHVALQPPDVLRPRRRDVAVERGERAVGGEDEHLRLALVLVVGEEMDAVLDDRPAERRADLLVLVRQHHVLHLVGGVQLRVAEIAADAAREGVGARLRDGVGDHPGRAPLRRVEAVRDHLELRDRVARETRLVVADADVVVGDLLAVDVDLRIPLAQQRHAARLILPAARGEHRQVHPVPAVDRQLLHLLRVDVARQHRALRVDERRFTGHGHRLLHRRGRQLQVERGDLPEQQVDAADDGGKARKLERQAIAAGPHRQAERADAVGDGDKGIARRFVQGGDGDAGEDAPRRVLDGAGQRRVLRTRQRGKREQDGSHDHGSDHWGTSFMRMDLGRDRFAGKNVENPNAARILAGSRRPARRPATPAIRLDLYRARVFICALRSLRVATFQSGGTMNPRFARLLLACLALSVPAIAWGQADSGNIAGVVRDTSGAVMPGVTVEASYPALIEKVRSVTTDSQGLYRIVDLRPRSYAVTFTLPGFGTVKREGIALTTGFTATVNAELKVGSLEETITVTGEAPVVDTQNVEQQQTLSRDVLDAIPTSRRPAQFITLIVGADGGANASTLHDVGGVGSDRAFFGVHGQRADDMTYNFGGMDSRVFSGGGFQYNAHTFEEVVVETAAGSAE